MRARVATAKWKSACAVAQGECEELMYEEIQGNYPLEFALRDQDKYRYRYPKGEVSSGSGNTFTLKGSLISCVVSQDANRGGGGWS